ncbi:MAG TPA: redox-sensing transcriptional repressor Rex [Candidatus Hydrogenedentes bacterium]|nr:redox-sensing transcriptional repressor Rex [Candidatus Hydrogenedentota bacterium]
MVSSKTIGRLSQYRRLLQNLLGDGREFVFSHELATMAGGTAAQVRRDVMAVGHLGSPSKGYGVSALLGSIADYLDGADILGVALVGVGNLGRALLAYFVGRHPTLELKAAFDCDPAKIGRVIHGCRCLPMEEMARVVEEERIKVGVITVPAEDAQRVATVLWQAGVLGIVNFAPVRLWTPASVHVEQIDLTTVLEQAAFFARRQDKDAGKEVGR